MARATSSGPAATSTAFLGTAPRSWFELATYGFAVSTAIALLEFAYYYPLVSVPGTRGVLLLGSLLVAWCGEGILLGTTVKLFELRNAPAPLGGRQLLLAVALGSVTGVIGWQAFVQWVLRERFGIWVLRDYMGQPVSFWGVVPYHIWLMLLFGGLGAAVHLSRQRRARMLTMLRASEIARETLQGQLAESSLASLQARIDPEYVFQALSKLEPLYERDPAAADRLLEELIVFLRGAVAHERAGRAPWAAREGK